MKKNKLLILLVIFSSLLFTGCSSTLTNIAVSLTSTMIRTVGIGENSMPIDKGSFTLEYFNEEAISVDLINETFVLYYGENAPENEHYISGKKSNDALRCYGFNVRYGIDNSTELKLGFLTGKIENGYSGTSNNSLSSNKSDTSLKGIQLGLKRLLTDYNSPHRVSVYAEGKYFTTSSEGIADKYDGSNLEVKSALLYGYLSDPATRNFPSVALYYSLANTKRNETIVGIPLKKQPQAVGLEANYSIDMGPVYYMVFAGLEKEIADKATNDINTFFGVKVGLHFNQLSDKKERNLD